MLLHCYASKVVKLLFINPAKTPTEFKEFLHDYKMKAMIFESKHESSNYGEHSAYFAYRVGFSKVPIRNKNRMCPKSE